MISEAASNNPRPRGRPRLLSEEDVLNIQAQSGRSGRTITTNRGAQDVAYRRRAATVLAGALDLFPHLVCLYDPSTGAMKHSILTELGRIPDEAVLAGVASRVAEHRPKTKDAVTAIRNARTRGGVQLAQEQFNAVRAERGEPPVATRERIALDARPLPYELGRSYTRHEAEAP